MQPERARVLVVDDSELALAEARHALEAAGYEVMTARDPGEAAGVLADRARRVDLVLMDVQLPEVYGDDAAAWLRARRDVRAPILLFSDLPDEELRQRALDARVEGHVSKRAGLEAMLERVRSQLGRDAPPVGLGLDELRRRFRGELVATARARVARARASRSTAALAGEMHALSGEAALVGAADLARAADLVRRAASSPQEALDALERSIAELARETAPSAEPTPDAPPAGRRILVVDDSDLYRKATAAILHHAGYEVVEARDLAGARAALRRSPPDLALLDVHLEDELGPDLIPDLIDRHPAPRVVILSGGRADGDVPGADLVLRKSGDTDLLLAEIARLLRR